MVILILMTALILLLPWKLSIFEVNTNKKVTGRLAVLSGLIWINIDFPLTPGFRSRILKKLGVRVSKSATGLVNPKFKKSGTGLKSFNYFAWRFKASSLWKVWNVFRPGLELEPIQGKLTISFSNPATTGWVFGGLQTILALPESSGLVVVPDFINHKTTFEGKCSLKILPARVVFLAIKYGFQTLKLFRPKN